MQTTKDSPDTEKGLILLEHPSYGWFWAARVAGGLAFQILAVVVGWRVYELTGSTFKLGMAGLVQYAPIVLFTLLAGHVADRYPRRLVYGLSMAVQALASLILTFGTLGHWLGIGGIFAMLALLGTSRSFQGPSGQALMPTLVPEALLPRAIAWSTGAFQTASIAGPSIGGLLYAFGPAVPFAVAAALIATGTFFVFLVKPERSDRKTEPATFDSVFSGVRFIRANPVILGSISLDLFAVLLGGATALLPVFAKDILHIGAWGLGIMRSAPAVGSLAMSVYLARRPLRNAVGRRMFAAVIVFGAATIVFGLSRSVPLSFASLLVLGAADTINVVIRGSLVQLQTPNEMRGRVSAVNWLFIGTSNQLGEFESGVTASMFGTVPATVLGGVGTLVVALAWMRLFPELRVFDSFGRKDALRRV